MELELQLPGSFVAVYDGRPLDTFGSNKTQALARAVRSPSLLPVSSQQAAHPDQH